MAKKKKFNYLNDASNAEHPIRRSAILILEGLDAYMGYPKKFPKDDWWYHFEDMIVDEIVQHIKGASKK